MRVHSAEQDGMRICKILCAIDLGNLGGSVVFVTSVVVLSLLPQSVHLTGMAQGAHNSACVKTELLAITSVECVLAQLAGYPSTAIKVCTSYMERTSWCFLRVKIMRNGKAFTLIFFIVMQVVQISSMALAVSCHASARMVQSAVQSMEAALVLLATRAKLAVCVSAVNTCAVNTACAVNTT